MRGSDKSYGSEETPTPEKESEEEAQLDKDDWTYTRKIIHRDANNNPLNDLYMDFCDACSSPVYSQEAHTKWHRATAQLFIKVIAACIAANEPPKIIVAGNDLSESIRKRMWAAVDEKMKSGAVPTTDTSSKAPNAKSDEEPPAAEHEDIPDAESLAAQNKKLQDDATTPAPPPCSCYAAKTFFEPKPGNHELDCDLYKWLLKYTHDIPRP